MTHGKEKGKGSDNITLTFLPHSLFSSLTLPTMHVPLASLANFFLSYFFFSHPAEYVAEFVPVEQRCVLAILPHHVLVA